MITIYKNRLSQQLLIFVVVILLRLVVSTYYYPAMAPKLYKMDFSPPVRSVYLTAAALGISLEYAEVNVYQQEHLKPEYLQINPQHTIPSLEDEGKTFWDSHAINAYLVTKYGKDDSLYPKDPYKKAVVDQRLHFDSGAFFIVGRRIVRLLAYGGTKTIPQDLIDDAIQGYDFLEKLLEGHQWVAGDQLTIADFNLVTSAIAMDVLVPVDANKYPNITAWIKRAQQLPYYNVIEKGHEDYKNLAKRLLS